MPKSTKLVTATYIMSYVAASSPDLVTTDRIARKVDEHPTRVRQIVAGLVKHGLLSATRGASGGVTLARPAAEITLRDITAAVHDASLLGFHVRDPHSEWAGKSKVHPLFENLRAELDGYINAYLARNTLDQTYTPIIVPFAPGGTTDLLARTLAEHLGVALGEPVRVEHKPQRAGAINPQHFTHATVNGRTLLVMTNSGVLSATLADPKADPVSTFVPVTLLAESEMILAVRSASRIRSVADLVRAAKARPGTLTFASVGYGSVSHLAMELFRRAAGIDVAHVPYEGAAPAVAALIAGKVAAYFGTPPTFLPHVTSERLRALATTALEKADVLPELPRVADTYPGFEITGWQGVFAPPGTSRAEVSRLNAQIVRVFSQPAVKAKLRKAGFRVATSTPPELAERIVAEVAKWRMLVSAANIEIAPGKPHARAKRTTATST
jgi:tripartite-type tricarboxylate transporter receptor subunit TctC